MPLVKKQYLSLLEHPLLLPASIGILAILLLTLTLGMVSRFAAESLENKALSPSAVADPAQLDQILRNYYHPARQRQQPLRLTGSAEKLDENTSNRYARLLPGSALRALLGKEPPLSLFMSLPALNQPIECRLDRRQDHRPDYINFQFPQKDVTIQGLYRRQQGKYIILSPCYLRRS